MCCAWLVASCCTSTDDDVDCETAVVDDGVAVGAALLGCARRLASVGDVTLPMLLLPLLLIAPTFVFARRGDIGTDAASSATLVSIVDVDGDDGATSRR
jgi:hypothetical protein